MHLGSNHSRRIRRGGFTIMEMAAALVVVSAAMIALVEFVSLATRQRRSSRQRLAALTEVANQAERVALLAWDEVAADRLTTWQPSAALAAESPQAECSAVVNDEPGLPAGRRVELSVSWPNAAGERVHRVSLTVWKYRGEAGP
jgi:type II secretory pathway pseudopilin PulG